jgi:hypothetical protein
VSNRPTTTDLSPSLEICRNHFTKWPKAKVEEVWQSFERAKVNGLWMWGKNPVNNPFEAFSLRLAERVTNAEPAQSGIAATLESLGKTLGVPPETVQPQSQPKPPARLFVSELKEKKQVCQERLKEIQYRGFEQPTGFKYANKDDRMAAKEIKQSIREIDDQILKA